MDSGMWRANVTKGIAKRVAKSVGENADQVTFGERVTAGRGPELFREPEKVMACGFRVKARRVANVSASACPIMLRKRFFCSEFHTLTVAISHRIVTPDSVE